MKLVLVLALAAVAVACGPSQTQTPAAPADSPKAGSRRRIRIPNDPFTWDLSGGGKAGPMGEGIGWAYNGVLGFKAGPDIPYHEQIPRPELAESWEVSPDGKTSTFKLRPGVKWANTPPTNGRDLTSADVKWAYEYWSRTGEFIHSAVRRIHEMAYSADLFYAPQWEAWHPALKNYAPNVGANGMPLENAWLDK